MNSFPMKESASEHNNQSLFMTGSNEKVSCGQEMRQPGSGNSL